MFATISLIVANVSKQLCDFICPIYFISVIDADLDRLEKREVITKVNYSSWIALIVKVEKHNGSLRIKDFASG